MDIEFREGFQKEWIDSILDLHNKTDMYSSIYDVVVDPEFQKQGIGRAIIQRLVQKAPGTCIHLTSTFGNEDFYKRIGFKRHKTAFGKYPWPSNYLED